MPGRSGKFPGLWYDYLVTSHSLADDLGVFVDPDLGGCREGELG